MRKYLLILIILSFFSRHSFAQQNNIWYFGKKAGLNFNQPATVVLHNSVMDADEGSASICDNSGNLLFYTNGITVYNRNHQMMLNGDGLLGNISTVQSGLIIPMPGNSNLYYIITTDAIENNFANGYNYSIVDMTGDNGNGEVVIKNVLFSASCTERMTAVRHADGISVWLITNDRNSNIFRAWLIDCSGMPATPVVSTAGVILNTYGLMNTGMMKISPDGKQLCQTHFPFFEEGVLNPNFFQLFDFDNATGIISNARTIQPANVQITSCEYSPNSRLLYLSRPYDKAIDQVEATLTTPAAIVASRISISTGNATFYGIQLAPDQKIYLSQPSIFLGAINKPNIKGTGCNFQKEQIDVNEGVGASAYAGLPSFINDLSFDGNNGFYYFILDSCTGTIQFNGNSTVPGTLAWQWDFGDGNTSSLQNPVHAYTVANQSYTVKLIIRTVSGCGLIERSKIIFPGGLSATADFDFESHCDSGFVRFTNLSSVFPDTSAVRFMWNFDDGITSTLNNPVHSFSSAGIYDIRLDVITSTPCLNKSVTKTLNLELLNISASPDREIEAGETVQLNVTGGGSIFTWTPATWLSNPAIANPMATPGDKVTYKVVVRNDAGCSDSDYVFIKVIPFPGIYMPTGFTPNNDGLNDDIKPTVTKEFTLQNFSIYNRWGEKIFSTAQKNTGWNGKVKGIVQDSGVYVWIISATDTRSGQKHEKKGTFIIIR